MEDRQTISPEKASAAKAALDSYNATDVGMQVKQAAESKARSRLASDRGSGDLRWFGLSPAGERDKGPRPACTYRGPRRNAARAARWPQRYRRRKAK